MSTNLYLRCVTHDPHISSDQVGHNLSVLPDLRESLAARDDIVKSMRMMFESTDFYADFGDSNKNALWWFLYRHPKCELEIWDEYNKQHPLIEKALKEWPPMPPLGDYVQLEDGGVFHHYEWAKFTRDGMTFDWIAIGSRVISHGTIHWRDAMGGVK